MLPVCDLAAGPGNIDFHLNYRWIDDYDTIFLNADQSKVSSHYIADASIDYGFLDHYGLSAYGRNLTDEETKRVEDIVNVEAFGQYTMGRNYGVEFVYEF